MPVGHEAEFYPRYDLSAERKAGGQVGVFSMAVPLKAPVLQQIAPSGHVPVTATLRPICSLDE